MRSPKLGSLAEWSGLLQWQIDWQILKAQKWGAASGARFSIHESRYSRGLQTECWTMVS